MAVPFSVVDLKAARYACAQTQREAMATVGDFQRLAHEASQLIASSYALMLLMELNEEKSRQTGSIIGLAASAANNAFGGP